ncbi:hypothetical protein [Dongia sp.]|uniref:hypothetical protein n=1 Tax=Dongia sp. TaxID=1977262 RepID=UPI0035B07293
MKEVAAFLISCSDELVALWLADVLLRLLLPRRAIGGVWTSLLENALVVMSAAGIERALPSLAWSVSGLEMMPILAMKALSSVTLTIIQRNHTPDRQHSGRLLAGRLPFLSPATLAMIALRCMAAFSALWLLMAAGTYAAFFVFPFVVLTSIDMALWLTCRFGWQGNALALPLESSLIITVLLVIVAASIGQGPARETMIILALILKVIVTRLSLGLQAHIKGKATDTPTQATWVSIVLRALGYAFGTWIVLS